MNTKFVIYQTSSPVTDYHEDFSYLLAPFPGSGIVFEKLPSGTQNSVFRRIVNPVLNLAKISDRDTDFFIFIPQDSIHVPILLIQRLIARLKAREAEAFIYDGEASYPLYNMYAYYDRCAACSRDFVEKFGMPLILQSLRDNKLPEGFKALKSDMDILYATYYRYLDTDIKPLSFLIEPTNDCNFKCRMCPYHGDPQRSSPTYIDKTSATYMSVELFDNIVDQIHDLKYKMITIVPQCRGEPLAHPRFLDILKTLHKYSENYISFSTNGSLMTTEMSKAFVEQQLYEVVISLHSTDRETYKKLGIGSNFDLVINNLENLLKIKKASDSDFPRVVLKFVEMKENKHEFYDFLRKWLIEKDGIYSVGICKENSYEWGDHNTMTYSGLFDFPGINTEERCPCNTALWSLPIYADGHASACISNYQQDLILGRLPDVLLQQIIYGEKRKAFLRSCNDRKHLDKHCLGCQGWVNHLRISGELHGLKIMGAAQMPFFMRKEQNQ